MRPRSKCPADRARARRTEIALLTVKEIFELVRDDLVKVEQELSRQSASAYQPVSEITSYLLGGGGKRLRPALLLLAHGYAAGSEGDARSAIKLAAVVELLHSATLIHDDVIDSADTRRGRPSANSRWGNHRSVLAGDWLYMQSFQMALEERNFRILDILIDLTQKMVEGELIQLAKIGRIDVNEEDALKLATYKTACLFSGCARLGAVLGGLSGDEKDFVSVKPETIVSLVHESGALDRARNLAHDFARRAKACIHGSQDSDYARALLTLPDFILDREN